MAKETKEQLDAKLMELKAQAYDLLAQKEQVEQAFRAVNEQIADILNKLQSSNG